MNSSRNDIDQWWPRLPASTRQWLMNNNGNVVPAGFLAEIEAAGGTPAPDAWWYGGSGPAGFSFSDAGVDWIEATANGESPGRP